MKLGEGLNVGSAVNVRVDPRRGGMLETEQKHEGDLLVRGE